MNNKHILLGITGSIAAYKSIELIRRLREHGAIVRVIMTPAALKFITPLTVQAISQQPVWTHLFEAMDHIELARWADMMLIAPASADFLAKLAYGHANDLLSTVCLATTAPITVAPAMNAQMWQSSATQDNCQRLRQHQVTFWGPDKGIQACGETGMGRMLAPADIVQALLNSEQTGKMKGQTLLITAGPTREDIDPVRFISNRSSGRMGYAIAEAALKQGATVTLVTGPVSLSQIPGVHTISVYNALEMFEAVMAHVATADIFIATAAVADYRPIQAATQKMKKNDTHIQLNLERTRDILAAVAQLDKAPFTVGFAAETEHLVSYAQEKLVKKNINMIAANIVGIEGIGFDSTDNSLHVFWDKGEHKLPRTSKKELAVQLLELIMQCHSKHHLITP